MESTQRVAKRALLSVCLFFLLTSAGYSQENSHVRIVRLSFTEGTVTVQLPGADAWSTAPVNTPIQEGFKLATASESFAEVQFENARSMVRIGELSEVEFNELELSPGGDHIDRMTLARGYATFHALPSPTDVYEVKAGDATFVPNGKAEFRLDIGDRAVRVEVFKGDVGFSGTEGAETLSKNMTLEFTPGSAEPYEIVQGVVPDDWDKWVKQRDETLASTDTVPPSAYTTAVDSSYYGWDDLNTYGAWNLVPTYGWAWFPAVSPGWAPYSLGRWCWYPGFGYTWIAGEPWGWLPYHYGDWFFDAAAGWFWVPGSMRTWQPALVTWYQGPGWVGWAPRRLPVHGSPNCRTGRTCMAVVPNDVLREGKPITPGTVYAVDLATGQDRRVQKPDVAPSQQALLPGSPAGRPVFPARGTAASSTRSAASVGDRPSYAAADGATAPPNVGRAAPAFNTNRPARAPDAAAFGRAPRVFFGRGQPAPSSTQGWTESHSAVRSQGGAGAARSWDASNRSGGSAGSGNVARNSSGGRGSSAVSSGGGGGGRPGGGGGPRGGGASPTGGHR